ncbi:hypothetical protein [Mesorhizobium xinjiangense]|uniref:hypothetical protein n=1 Tax=Mesorhizobium xinjiangense TaxID=2678685 RepID=UPI0012EE9832|nr:hypothetical protein [Mesorhizobium xinjiangense]
MTVTITPFLRKALLADALVSGAAAFVMAAGAGVLDPLTGLPAALLFWAGLALIPFVLVLAVVARRETVSRLVLIDIIAINALWVAGSFAILLAGAVAPNLLGYVFVAAQALTVALFAELQFVGLRRSAA